MAKHGAAVLTAILGWLALAFPVHAQGTLNIALQQQFAFTGCSTAANVCGTPLAGGLLYVYQVGTASTRQDSFQDTALTIPNPWPLVLDANGRVPMFYLASGSVHVRLTDAGGVVQFDYPSMLVVGPSGGGGGGGGTVDATAIASTGDIKFRMTGETLLNWVKLNGQKIGNVGSAGADITGAQYQNLYNYLWTNCPDAHCPVNGGRGISGNADWGAGKYITLPDWRGRAPFGLDDMGNALAGRIQNTNITSGGSDTVSTPGAWGGESYHTLTLGEMPAHAHAATITDPGHAHAITDVQHSHTIPGTFNAGTFNAVSIGSGLALLSAVSSLSTNPSFTGITGTNSANTGITFNDGLGHLNTTQNTGGGTAANNMSPFLLGSWYMRL